jgi:hypothetical protein
MRLTTLFFWSFVVSAMFSLVFHYYADEIGFPKEFAYAVTIYLCIGLIGVGFMKVRYTKFGFFFGFLLLYLFSSYRAYTYSFGS